MAKNALGKTWQGLRFDVCWQAILKLRTPVWSYPTSTQIYVTFCDNMVTAFFLTDSTTLNILQIIQQSWKFFTLTDCSKTLE